MKRKGGNAGNNVAWRKGKAGLLCLTVILALGGCGQETDRKEVNVSSNISNVKDVLKSQMEGDQTASDEKAENRAPGKEENENGAQASENAKETKAENESKPEMTGSVDVDLTTMSSTMVYSEVYNMMYYPENYEGLKVRMNGQYTYTDAGENRYDLCIIKDAAACCAQGMEFLLTDAYAYPGDYPEDGEEIIVEGTFVTYMEGEYQYCTLKDASWLAE